MPHKAKHRAPPVWTETREELNWNSGKAHDLGGQGFNASRIFSCPGGAVGLDSRSSDSSCNTSTSSCSRNSNKRTKRAWQDKVSLQAGERRGCAWGGFSPRIGRCGLCLQLGAWGNVDSRLCVQHVGGWGVEGEAEGMWVGPRLWNVVSWGGPTQ